jgi:hypothetical protein
MGVPPRQRGPRTDEALDLLMGLLTDESVSLKGSFGKWPTSTIYPNLASGPRLWVARGSLGHAPETPDKPHIPAGVLRRILRAEGWMARSSGSDADMVKVDWEVVESFCRPKAAIPSRLRSRTLSSFTSSTPHLETMRSMSRCLTSFA